MPKAATFCFLSLLVFLAVYATAQTNFTFSTIDPPNTGLAQASGINNSGVVVGSAVDFTSTTHAFVWNAGVFTIITAPESSNTTAHGINDLGDVVGGYIGQADNRQHGFILRSNLFTTIDFPNASLTDLTGINNSSTVIGISNMGFPPSGFLLENNNFTTLPFLTSGINSSGDVVGTNFFGGGVLFHAGVLTSIAVPGGLSNGGFSTSPNSINNVGIIAGHYFSPDFHRHGFILQNGSFTTVDYPGASDTSIFGINDSGAIVGQYFGPVSCNGAACVFGNHAFVATPPQACVRDKVVSIDIADTCVQQWLQPWSQTFGDGTTLEVSCSLAFNTGQLPAPAYMAWFTDSGGKRSRIAQCLFKDGYNDATYTVGHSSANPAQSCLVSVDWQNVDGGTNDSPRQATDFLGTPIIFTTSPEPYIDDVDYRLDASRNKLSWKDEKFPYPDATQVADQFAVGDILNGVVKPVADLTYSVDPLIGPELDNAFDTVWLEMQKDSGGPMRFIPGCDLNADGVCDASDQAMLTAAVGKCAGQAGYIPRIDYDGDGCIGASDAAVVQTAFSAYRTGCVRSQGYWKNHADKWPLASLSIGGNQYNNDDLLAILQSSVGGNGAIDLAHQLIAAKLNIASGASPVAAPVSSADALLNSAPGPLPPVGNAILPPSSVSGLVDTLARFNEGLIGPPECEE